MGLHGLHRKLEAIGDFLGAEPLGDKLQHLALPRREVVSRRLLGPDSLHVAFHHLLGDRRAEIRFALPHSLYPEIPVCARGHPLRAAPPPPPPPPPRAILPCLAGTQD